MFSKNALGYGEWVSFYYQTTKLPNGLKGEKAEKVWKGAAGMAKALEKDK